ncbi:MAG: hypothetical protein CVU03_01160 [Bacteroidetes bacterium HGW-Bacteroidetes-2]|nr:MAG: hypothetical protein CVU03_01160 [Bacteroidetes bacterium HGW-Bacteroidetes-2]
MKQIIVLGFLFSKRFSGITLWPFILLKHAALKNDAVFINHERIHLRQQAEMLIVPFYIWYSIEYLVRLAQFKNKYEAYKNISFEREAYANESRLEYIKNRKYWAFMAYLKTKKPPLAGGGE